MQSRMDKPRDIWRKKEIENQINEHHGPHQKNREWSQMRAKGKQFQPSNYSLASMLCFWLLVPKNKTLLRSIQWTLLPMLVQMFPRGRLKCEKILKGGYLIYFTINIIRGINNNFVFNYQQIRIHNSNLWLCCKF